MTGRRSLVGSTTVLGAGEVLVQGSAVVMVLAAMRQMVQVGRRDGIVSVEAAGYVADFEEAVFRLRNVTAPTEYRDSGSVSESAEQVHSSVFGVVDVEIDAREAARLMGCDERNVRALSQRGSLVSARKSGGRWVMSRAEVLEVVAVRSSAQVAS